MKQCFRPDSKMEEFTSEIDEHENFSANKYEKF